MVDIGIDPANTTVLITGPKSTSSGPKASSGTDSAPPDGEQGKQQEAEREPADESDSCIRDNPVPCRHR
jgi:hypothetical protein